MRIREESLLKETRYHLRSGLLVGRPIWLPQGRDCHSPRTGTDLLQLEVEK